MQLQRFGIIVAGVILAGGLVYCLGCSRGPLTLRERREWLVMGTVAAVQTRGAGSVDGEEHFRASVSNLFRRVETLLNAHNPESELRRLAELADAEILDRCDPLVRPCYEAAFRFRDESGGVFDPRWRGVGTMDLGGVAKGFALELAAALPGASKAGDRLLDLGGNLKSLRGTWQVGVLGGDSLSLPAGFACATSAEYFRGRHIFNARTHEAVSNEVESVTVVAPSALAADALSTILYILGRDEGERFLRRYHPDCRALWVLR